MYGAPRAVFVTVVLGTLAYGINLSENPFFTIGICPIALDRTDRKPDFVELLHI
jgi:hypothetical protein